MMQNLSARTTADVDNFDSELHLSAVAGI